MDEVEKAKSPPFLSMSPVPDAYAAPLFDVSQESASLRSDGGRPFAGFTRFAFAASPGVCALQMRIDIEIAVTTACATGATHSGLRDHSWEKRPSPRGSQSRPEHREQEFIAITLRARGYSAFAQPDCSES